MTVTDEGVRAEGLVLRRYICSPDDPAGIRGSVIHFHGHGDHSMRHGESFEVFTSQGIACVSMDLPGHGLSEGTRGDMPGWDIIDHLTRLNLARCREICPSGPLGIIGHSAGGLLALRELLMERDRYSFSWISSPLLRPEVTRHPMIATLLLCAARLAPRLRIRTGVSRDMCRHTVIDPDSGKVDDPAKSPLSHGMISLGWASSLVTAGRWVREEFARNPPRFPILITQGADDAVCPVDVVRRVLREANAPAATYVEFPGLLHEPFADTGKDEVFATVTDWLAASLEATAQEGPPCG